MVNKMSWKDTIRKKHSKSMSTHAIGLIEYVLTSEPQSLREIIEAMFEKGQEYVDSKKQKYAKFTTHNHSRIPTSNELKRWLIRQPHIESARFDKWTNKKVERHTAATRSELKFWRP